MEHKGLTADTAKIFEHISKLECIKDYTLVGGTALSLQLQTRLSEDLDFMQWKDSKNDRKEVDWKGIEKELSTIGKVNTDVLDFKQVLFQVDQVKLSFYIRDSFPPPNLGSVPFMNHIKLADTQSIGAMKIEAMMRRSVFRDYYDLYSIVKHGGDLEKIIFNACKYSNHAFKTKNIHAALMDFNRFVIDKGFEKLNAIHSVDAREISDFFKLTLKDNEKVMFQKNEIPFDQLAGLGISANDFSDENIKKLLKGEKTDVFDLKIKDKLGASLSGRFSLQKDADLKVNFLFHQEAKQKISKGLKRGF